MSLVLRRSPLGLALIGVAASELATAARLIVTLVHIGDGLGMTAVVAASSFVTAALQLAAGAALVWAARPRLWLLAYVASACVLAVAGGYEVRDDGAAGVLAVAIETLGWPIIVAVTARWRDRLGDERERGDVAAALLALGVGGGLTAIVDCATLMREMIAQRASVGEIAGVALPRLLDSAVAALAIAAGLRTTRRRFVAYLVAALGVNSALTLVSIVTADVQRDLVIPLVLVSLVASSIAPLTLWWYVRDRYGDERVFQPEVLAWRMLGFAAFLVGQVVVFTPSADQLGARSMIARAVAATLAVVLGGAALAMLRRAQHARALVWAAAAAGAAVAVVVLLAAFLETARPENIGLGRVAMLVAAPAVCAFALRRSGNAGAAAGAGTGT